ncbi:hypothetical protein FOZ62_024942 [Perkinsus olseni]|uniref:non-specific serine/threonine protein kinase n=1 Tax=Perkinsus olseni TaxID=32597 RepID=A0A7J6SGG7_PEROL|nr:hypothetical protein FOZ62_024942 [Perkinsus olseni]
MVKVKGDLFERGLRIDAWSTLYERAAAMIFFNTLDKEIPWMVLVNECWLEDVGGVNRQSQVVIVMEMVDGFTLSQYLQKVANPRGRMRLENSDDEEEPRVPSKTIYRWLSQILVSLVVMHKNRVIHRDLKTDNILITRDLRMAKVCDFSVARVIDRKGGLLTGYVGTPNYAAPEVLTGRVYDTSCDMWSLGCCLHEMLTLKQCFKGPPLKILKQIQKGIIPPLPDDVDSSLDMMCHRLLNPNPAKRPTAIELCKHPAMREHIADLIRSVPHMCNVISEILGVPLPPDLQPIVDARLAKLAERREMLVEPEKEDECADEGTSPDDGLPGDGRGRAGGLVEEPNEPLPKNDGAAGGPTKAVAADFVSSLGGSVDELVTAGIEIDEDADFEDLLVEQDEELQVSIVALLQGAWEATGDMSFNVRELDVDYEGDSGIRLRIYRAHRKGNLGRAEFLLNDAWLMVKEETSFLPPQYITWQRIDQQDLYLPEVMCWMRPVACAAEEQQHALPAQEDPSAQPRSTSADNINVAEVTLHIHSILDHVLVQCGLALELEKMEGVSMSVRRVNEDSLRANLWRAQPLVRRMDINNHLVRKLGPRMSGSFEFASGSMNLLEAFVTLFQPPLVRATRPIGELSRSRASAASDCDEWENLMPFKLLRLLVEPVASTDIFTCTPIGAILQTGRGLASTEIRNFKRGPRRVRSSIDAAFASELVDKKKFLTATVGSAKVDPLTFMSVGGPLEVSQPAGRPSESPRKSVYRTGVKRLTFGRVSHHLEVCLLSTVFADDIVEQNCGLLLACTDDEVEANKGNDVLRRLLHFRLQRMEEESSAGRALHIGVFEDGSFAGVISIGTERTQKGVMEDKFAVRLADAIAGPDSSKSSGVVFGDPTRLAGEGHYDLPAVAARIGTVRSHGNFTFGTPKLTMAGPPQVIKSQPFGFFGSAAPLLSSGIARVLIVEWDEKIVQKFYSVADLMTEYLTDDRKVTPVQQEYPGELSFRPAMDLLSVTFGRDKFSTLEHVAQYGRWPSGPNCAMEKLSRSQRTFNPQWRRLRGSDPLDGAAFTHGEGRGHGFDSWWWPIKYLGLSVPSLTHSWLALRAGRKKKISEDLEKFESDRRIEEETNTALAIEFAKLQQDMVRNETSKDVRDEHNLLEEWSFERGRPGGMVVRNGSPPTFLCENAAAPVAVFERKNSCDEDGTARDITAGDLRGRSTQELQCLKQAWAHRMESRTFTQQADVLEEAASEGARFIKATRAKLKRIREECSDREMIAKLAKDAATAAKRKGDPSYGALKQAKRERRTEFRGCERAKNETLEELQLIEKEVEESKASMEQARSRAKKHIECAVACEKSGDHAIGRVEVEQQLGGVSAELGEVLGRLRGLEEERADLQEEINVKEQLLGRLSAEISSAPPTSRIRSVHQAKIRLNRQEVSDARQKLDVIDGKVKAEQKQQEKLKKEINELKDALELIEKFSHRRKFKDRLGIVDRLNRSTASLKDLNKKVGGARAELEMIDDMAAESKELLELVEETRAKAEIFMLYPASDRAYCASIGASRGRESFVAAGPIRRSRSIERWFLEDEWIRLEIPLTLRREGLECVSPREVHSIGIPESPTVVIFYSPWNRECMRRRDDMVTAGKELLGLPVCGTEELRVVFVNVESVDSDIGSLEEAARFIDENHLEGRLLPVVKLHKGSEIFFYEGTLTPLRSVKDWIVDNCSSGGGPREVSGPKTSRGKETEQIPTGAPTVAMKSQFIYSLPFMSSDARVSEKSRASLVDVRDHSVTRRMGQSGGVTVAMWLKCDSVTITRPETVLLSRYSNFEAATFSRLAVTVDRRRRVILHWLSYAAGSDSQTLTGHSAEFPTQKEVSTALVQCVFSRRDASVAAVGEIADLKILPRMLNVAAIANEVRARDSGVDNNNGFDNPDLKENV